MEPRFGADFSGVKVHTDAQADQLNRSVQARAFTTGQDVFFRQGEYNPASRGGQELIAHELTHVVQQNGRKNALIQTAKTKNRYKKNKKKVESNNPNVIENSKRRVEEYGANWEERSWRKHIKELGLSLTSGSGGGGSTDTGKAIFSLTNGDEIVCDMSGYWRHHLSNGRYADKTGAESNDNAQTHFRSK